MSTWSKVILRTIGILNCVAVLLGLSFLVDSIFHVLTGRVTVSDDAPYFGIAFTTMAAIEVAFASAFVVTSISLIRTKLSAVNPYSVTVILRIAYFIAIGQLWRTGGGVGASIASATAVSDVMTPFDFLLLAPFLYPLLSTILVQLLRWRYNRLPLPITP